MQQNLHTGNNRCYLQYLYSNVQLYLVSNFLVVNKTEYILLFCFILCSSGSPSVGRDKVNQICQNNLFSYHFRTMTF